MYRNKSVRITTLKDKTIYGATQLMKYGRMFAKQFIVNRSLFSIILSVIPRYIFEFLSLFFSKFTCMYRLSTFFNVFFEELMIDLDSQKKETENLKSVIHSLEKSQIENHANFVLSLNM
jgi:hypothetical protein